ncbi:glycosyltransferase family 2 protein [Paramicrobacterium chengjingii]|uniref:Glycosyltransferase n=1 Tax=Paramicrobacterium chengjingii TaxID=2769067 RepID=A0ABX6YL01_9MICO|nr:glycosyltransferase [Microbacterium chengjingii]QPZ39410.1 glycosyltransferase [Microbacterium chengjingii]
MTKITVVVPTYKPGKGLNRLVGSLEAQTLESQEFEVIFVDDGSPDDTFPRLRELERTHANFRVLQIPNSGWASAPRNVGISEASGEYIAFVDHDDCLYPDALRAAYEFAQQNHSDVLSGKEARTNDASWGIATYTEDIGNALHRKDINSLIPMNPHKVYRRHFLNDHNIRFPEGQRVLWEDIFFNIQVLSKAEVISVMTSTPYYHWVQTAGSGSTTFRRSNEEWWNSLRKIFDAIYRDLESSDFDLERNQLLLHQLRTRVLSTYNRAFSRRPESERQMANEFCASLVADFVPQELDRELDARSRVRAELLRSGSIAELESFSASDMALAGTTFTTSIAWSGPQLVLEAKAEWSRPDGEAWVEVTNDGQRLLAIEPSLRQTVSTSSRVLEGEIRETSARIGIRSRKDRIVWMIPTEGTSELVLNSTGTIASLTVRSQLDVRDAASGSPLSNGAWDVNGRTEFGPIRQQTALKHTGIADTVGFIDGRSVLAYCNRDGALSLDIGATTKPIWPNLSFGDVTSLPGTIEADLPQIHVFGTPVDFRFRYVLRRNKSLMSRIVHSYKLNYRLALFPLLSRFIQVRSGRLLSRQGRAVLEIARPRRRGTYLLEILPQTGNESVHLRSGKRVDRLELHLGAAGPTLRRVGMRK